MKFIQLKSTYIIEVLQKTFALGLLVGWKLEGGKRSRGTKNS